MVLAVTPFTAPPESFDDFDLDYYATIVTGIDREWERPRRRLVAVGLTAMLRLDSGVTNMDDRALFPPALRPFAHAHARQLSALRNTTLDWAILTPPAGFGTDPEPAAGWDYRLVAEPLTRARATARLSYARYARAVAAESARPDHPQRSRPGRHGLDVKPRSSLVIHSSALSLVRLNPVSSSLPAPSAEARIPSRMCSVPM